MAMQKKKKAKIEEILTPDFYSRYSGLLTLSDLSLVITDPTGYILYEFNPTPDFCKCVCQTEQHMTCPACINATQEENESGAFVCPNGLCNIIVPIWEENAVVAYVIGGRAYSHETEYQKYMLDIPKFAERQKLDPEFVAKTCSMLKTADRQKIEAHAQLCTYIAQSISRSLTSGMQAPLQSIERDMLEKKIIDLEAKNNSLMVNPHFLFNTLNCIARIAYFEHAPKTEELIYYLSDLLRYNVQNNQSLHTIQAELDNIEKYLYIQKARFQSRLQYSINVPEHIRSCRIPNMVLQPVVENALIHGISPKRDGGKIDIYAENHGDKIMIFVVDNGNGFDKEVLKRLKEKDPDNSSKMGLRITDRRVKQYYGEEYGLEIVKSDYSGSTVSITISKSLIAR